ncbi:MAG: ribonucleoside-diphosphate reductase, adenosylcobalamin-dependent, partial [Bacillota bacterium]
VESVPDAVAKALEMHINGHSLEEEGTAMEEVSAADENHSDASSRYSIHVRLNDDNDADDRTEDLDLCPACGSATLINEEGCKHCISCGYNRCG